MKNLKIRLLFSITSVAISMLAILFGIGCVSESSSYSTGIDNDAGLGPTSPEFQCIAGDYDTDDDDIINYSLECFENGNLKTYTTYYADGTTIAALIRYQSDGTRKDYEYTFYESNGYDKSYILYQSDGITKDYEYTFYESNENVKSYILYFSNGYPKEKTDYQSDGSTLWFQYTYYESNGNEKMKISYRLDGVTKSYERSYYENSNPKTFTSYALDGEIADGYPICYDETNYQFAETCTSSEHGI